MHVTPLLHRPLASSRRSFARCAKQSRQHIFDPSSTYSVSLGSHPKDPAYQNTPASPPPPSASSSASGNDNGNEPPSTSPETPPSDSESSTENPENLPATVPFDPAQFAQAQAQPTPDPSSPPNAPGSGRGRNPPFHTHAFFVALEKSFPSDTARGLMRATSALLSDRIGRVRRDGLTRKNMDNQAYLFRAALSELKSEISNHSKNESAALQTSTVALRREVDRLDVQIREDVATLRHEIQMEFDSRKNEVRSEFKDEDILIEEMLSKNLVRLNNLKTDVEENRWVTMRRTVSALAGFVLTIIVSLELQPKKATPVPIAVPPPSAIPLSTSDSKQPEAEGLEKMDWVT